LSIGPFANEVQNLEVFRTVSLLSRRLEADAYVDLTGDLGILFVYTWLERTPVLVVFTGSNGPWVKAKKAQKCVSSI
jgi:hypothetical protein